MPAEMRPTRLGPGMRLVWMLGLAAALVTSTAGAQADDADALVAEGIELRVQGRDAEALDRFRKAVELAPNSPRARGQLALALHAVQEWVESERVMESVVADSSDEWVARHRAKLEQSLQTVRMHLGWVVVDAAGPGTAWLDGHRIGSLPIAAPVRVVAARHALEIRSRAHAPIRKDLEIAPGQKLLVSVALASPAPASTPALPGVPSGPEPEHEDSGLGSRHYGMALLGFGAAGLVAGAAFGVDAIVLRGRRDDVCGRDECTGERGIRLDAWGRQAAMLSNVFLAAGLSGAIIGGALLWEDHSSRTRVSLTIAPGGARLQGRW